MQILSRNDHTFQKLCQPKIDVKQGVEVTENSIKVIWEPAPIENLVKGWKKLKIESYEIMIHPAEKSSAAIKKKDQEKPLAYQYNDLDGKIHCRM